LKTFDSLIIGMMILISGVLGTIVLFMLTLGSNFMIFLVRRDPELIPNEYITLLYVIVILIISGLIIFCVIIPLNNKFRFITKLRKEDIESSPEKKFSPSITLAKDKKPRKKINLNFFSKIRRKKKQPMPIKQIKISKSEISAPNIPQYSESVITRAVDMSLMPSKAELLRAAMMALDKSETELAREFVKHAKKAE